MPPSRPTCSLLATLAAAGIAFALAACGGSSPGVSSSASAAEDEAKAQKFAKCMRERGIEASAVKGPGGGTALKVTARAAGKGNPQALEAAQKACNRFQPGGERVNLSPAQRAEQQDRLLRFARCMREHGIDLKDEASAGRVGIMLHGVDPESPKFQAAQNACKGLFPKPKGIGGPSTQASGVAPAAGPSTGGSSGVQSGAG